jgi:hypothetical protein
VLSRNRDGILSDHSFTSRCMRCNENTVALLETVYRSFLEIIEFEGVRNGGVRHHLLEAGHVDLVLHEPLLSLVFTLCTTTALYF